MNAADIGPDGGTLRVGGFGAERARTQSDCGISLSPVYTEHSIHFPSGALTQTLGFVIEAPWLRRYTEQVVTSWMTDCPGNATLVEILPQSSPVSLTTPVKVTVQFEPRGGAWTVLDAVSCNPIFDNLVFESTSDNGFDAIGILGGWLVAVRMLGTNPILYERRTLQFLDLL